MVSEQRRRYREADIILPDHRFTEDRARERLNPVTMVAFPVKASHTKVDTSPPIKPRKWFFGPTDENGTVGIDHIFP